MRRHRWSGAAVRTAAMVLAGGMLVTGLPAGAAAAMSPAAVPPTPVAISGLYDFASVAQVWQSIEERAVLSGDGSRIATSVARPTGTDVLEEDGLWLIDTSTGDGKKIFENSVECRVLNEDGGVFFFSGGPEGRPTPSDVWPDAWGYRLDVDADRIGAFPVPDLSLRGDAYDDRLCPLATSADGNRALFLLWDRVFLADWTSGDPVAIPLLDEVTNEYDAPLAARLSADGTRMFVDGARRWQDDDYNQWKETAVYTVAAEPQKVWSKQLEKEQVAAASADVRTVAWLQRGESEESWSDPEDMVLMVADPDSGVEARSSIPLTPGGYAGSLPNRAYLALTADGVNVFATTHQAVHRLDRTTGEVVKVADATAAFDSEPCGEDCAPLIAELAVSDDGRTMAFLLTDIETYRQDAQPKRIPEVVVGQLEQAPNTAPTWPRDAAVSTTSSGVSFASVAWDAAVDDRGVTGYEVSLDGTVVETTSARIASFDGLKAETSYAVSVVPLDADGARGAALTGTFTTTAPAELAALSATAQPDGTVLLRWDPAADAEGYRVLRSIGSGDEEPVGEPSEATWVDTGAPADAELTYRVALASGAEHTTAATVSTAAIPEPGVSWTTTRQRGGLIDVTTAIGLDVTSQPHRQVTAILTGKDADGAAVTVPVALAEGDAGRYTGELENLLGMSVIETVHAVVADGHGHEVRGDVAWTTVPAAVSGAVDVVLDADATAAGIVLDIADEAEHRSHQSVFEDEQRMLVPFAPSAGASIALWRTDGERGGEATGIVVEAGRVTTQTIGLLHPASLEITVTGSDGKPLPDITVEVNVPGAPNATTGTTNADGVTESSGWTNRMRAEVRLSSKLVPLRDQPPTVIDLVPGKNTVTIAAPLVPEGIVRGTVTHNGARVAGTSVRLTQITAGVAVVRTTQTGEDGVFSLAGFHGEANVAIGLRTGYKYFDVVIGSDAVVLDQTMITLGTNRLEARIRTQPFGAPGPGPEITIDGSVISHMRVRAESESDDGVWRRVGPSSSDGRWLVYGYPGQRVRICADAWEAGGPAGCGEPVTMTADSSTLIGDVVLKSRARLSMQLTDRLGAPLTGPWKASITTESGVLIVFGDGARLETDLPAGGTYQVWVNHRRMTTNYGVTSVTVADGTHLRHTEALVVGQQQGPFRGDGNAIIALQSEVMAGDTVEMRATFRARSAVARAELALDLPVGWESIPDGATVNGEAVVVRQEGDRAVVAIGDIAEGEEGIVRVVLRVPAAQMPGDFQVNAKILVAGTTAAHDLGQAGLRIAEVELVAPKSVSERSALLNGRAPAGSIVSILEDDVPVGIALADPSGRWEARVAELRAVPVGTAYRLRATVEANGVERSSALVHTAYDPYLPRITEVAMLQDQRAVRFDPADGVARFPFVYSQNALRVQLSFDHPGLIRTATVWFGDRSAEAVRGDDGRFTAEFPLKFGQEGDISVTFEADRLPADLTEGGVGLPTTLEAVRALLPPAWRDVEIDDVSLDQADDGVDRMHATARIPASGSSGPVEMSMTVTVTDAPGATASEESARIARAAGVPVHHGKITVSADGLSGTATGLFIPEAEGAMRVAAITPSAVTVPKPLPRWLTIAWDITGIINGTNTLIQDGERTLKMERTVRDLEELQPCTEEGFNKLAALKERARPMALRAKDLDIIAVVFTVMGTSASLIPNPKASIAVGEFLWAVEQDVQAWWDSEYAAIRRGMREIEEGCGEKRKKPLESPVAQPIPIYDPSGYVFEGVESNRLAGVTATVMHAPTAEGPWRVWDAEWYGQRNPHDTDAEGRYGWDVPIGYWQVRYEKKGYVTGFSDVLKVLPPHFDVNVGLAPANAPGVKRMTAAPGGVLIEFDQYMRADWFSDDSVAVNAAATALAIAAADGTTDAAAVPLPMAGDVVPVDAATTPGGVSVAKSFRFVFDDEVAEGRTLEVLVRAGVRNHVDRPMIADAVGTVTVADAPDPGDGDPGDGDPGDGDPGDGDSGNGDPGNGDPGDGGSPWPGGGDPGTGGGSNPGGADPQAPKPDAALPATGGDSTVPLVVALTLLLLGFGLRQAGRLRDRRAAAAPASPASTD